MAHSDFQTTSVSTSLDDFSRSALQLIAELPSCSEEKLFIVAVNRELERSRDLSLGDLKLLLHNCVQQLEAQGLLKIQAGGLVITERGNRLLDPRGNTERSPEPTTEETPDSIPETSQAKGQTDPSKAQADEEGGSEKIIGDEIPPIPNDGGAAPAIEEEEILDLAAELGGLEIVEDDNQPVVEVMEVDPAIEVAEVDDDITPVLNDGGAAPAIEEEEILDLAAELGGLEIVEDDDQPAIEVTEVDETLDLDEPEPSALERAVAVFKAEHVPTPTTLQAERFQKTPPQQAKARIGVESSLEECESASMLETIAKPEKSGLVLTAAAEMMRDIVTASLLIALAAISVMSRLGDKPSLTTVLIMLGLLLVGSAVWGWRGHRQ